MDKSPFNLNFQNSHLASKIVAGLERVSEAFRALLWDHAKEIGLSPIQIQIILFVSYHEESLCSVSSLAREFNVTKPTISDAIRVLNHKGLIRKHQSPVDKRAYTIVLSEEGKGIAERTRDFTAPINATVEQLSDAEQGQFFESLSSIIYGLNRAGVLTVQRTCRGCRFYAEVNDQAHCRLMEVDLQKEDIRIDCPEFEAKAV